MNLLDRYILKSVLFTCGAAFGLVVFILVVVNAAKDLMNYILAGQIDWLTAGKLVPLLIPAVLPFALPVGILTGVLLTLGRLSADNEITAMRAAGISLARITRPIFILAALAAAFGAYANFNAMPWARVTYEREFDDLKRNKPLSLIVPRTFIRDFKGCVIYVGEKQGTLLRDFWLWKLDNQGRVYRFLRAESGRIEYDESFNGVLLTLTRARAEDRDEKNPENFAEPERVLSFEEFGPEKLPFERLFGPKVERQKKLAWMTYDELQAEQARINAQKVPATELKQNRRAEMRVRLALHEKWNTAFVILSFALIGVPLGVKVSRKESSANLGIAIVLGLSYYFLTAMVRWLESHPEYRPDLLLWLPNLIFLALGIWLFRRIERK